MKSRPRSRQSKPAAASMSLIDRVNLGLRFILPRDLWFSPLAETQSSTDPKRRVASYTPTVRKREADPIQVQVNLMTNWQRNQWARAGYPKGMEKLEHFASLQRGDR